MSRILIAYSSKTGTARQCAELLAAELKGLDTALVDLDHEQPDLRDFDVVVLGSSVRFGKLRPSLAQFLKTHSVELTKKSHGLFLCCGFGHDFEEYSEKRFSKELRDSAFAVMNFGGTLKLKHADLLERFFLYRVRCAIRETEIDDGEYTPTLPGILPENIGMMASSIRSELVKLKRTK